MSNKTDILGVDVGGVILDFIPYADTELDFRSDNYLQTPMIEGAVESLAELNRERFAGNVYLVSRSGSYGPARTIEWLEHHDFFRRTGIPKDFFFNCSQREEKAGICSKLGITHFVDDRAEVLSHLIGIVPNLYRFRSLDENPEEFAHVLPHVTSVTTWREVLEDLRTSR